MDEGGGVLVFRVASRLVAVLEFGLRGKDGSVFSNHRLSLAERKNEVHKNQDRQNRGEILGANLEGETVKFTTWSTWVTFSTRLVCGGSP